MLRASDERHAHEAARYERASAAAANSDGANGYVVDKNENAGTRVSKETAASEGKELNVVEVETDSTAAVGDYVVAAGIINDIAARGPKSQGAAANVSPARPLRMGSVGSSTEGQPPSAYDDFLNCDAFSMASFSETESHSIPGIGTDENTPSGSASAAGSAAGSEGGVPAEEPPPADEAELRAEIDILRRELAKAEASRALGEEEEALAATLADKVSALQKQLVRAGGRLTTSTAARSFLSKFDTKFKASASKIVDTINSIDQACSCCGVVLNAWTQPPPGCPYTVMRGATGRYEIRRHDIDALTGLHGGGLDKKSPSDEGLMMAASEQFQKSPSNINMSSASNPGAATAAAESITGNPEVLFEL